MRKIILEQRCGYSDFSHDARHFCWMGFVSFTERECCCDKAGGVQMPRILRLDRDPDLVSAVAGKIEL